MQCREVGGQGNRRLVLYQQVLLQPKQRGEDANKEKKVWSVKESAFYDNDYNEKIPKRGYLTNHSTQSRSCSYQRASRQQQKMTDERRQRSVRDSDFGKTGSIQDRDELLYGRQSANLGSFVLLSRIWFGTVPAKWRRHDVFCCLYVTIS